MGQRKYINKNTFIPSTQRNIKKINKLSLFALAFEEDQLPTIPDSPHIHKINLSTLPLGELQSNQFCEHRIFFTDLPSNENAEYLGFVTWRWNEKYNNLIKLENLHESLLPLLQPNIVFAAVPALEWFEFSCSTHPGMEKYLQELGDYTNLMLGNQRFGFWSNNFICHKLLILCIFKNGYI